MEAKQTKTIIVRGVNIVYWREARALALREGLTMGELLNKIIGEILGGRR